MHTQNMILPVSNIVCLNIFGYFLLTVAMQINSKREKCLSASYLYTLSPFSLSPLKMKPDLSQV